MNPSRGYQTRSLILLLLVALLATPLVAPTAAESGDTVGIVTAPQDFLFDGDESEDQWVPHRSAPSGGWRSETFEGRQEVLRYGVNSTAPSADPEDRAFFRWEGLSRSGAPYAAAEVDLFIDPDWADRAMQAGLWVAGKTDDGQDSEGWGIVEFNTARFDESAEVHEDARWRVWVSGEAQWTDLDLDVVFGEWVNLRIELDVEDQAYQFYINGESAGLFNIDLNHPLIERSTHLGQTTFNSYNYAFDEVRTDFSNEPYDVRWHGLRHDVIYNSVREAASAALPGDTVTVGPGIYTEDPISWAIDKPLKIRGAGSEQVTIDRSEASSYGLLIDSDNVTLEGFTFIGPSGDPAPYGLKIESVADLTVDDVVVRDSGRTGIDLNGVHNATLTKVKSRGNGGAGIAIRDSTAITIESASTNGNAWGGLALWAVDDEILSDVSITNSSFAGEPAGVFVQHSGTFTRLHLANNSFTGNEIQVSDQSEVNALDMETMLTGNHFDRAVVVRDGLIKVPAIFSRIGDGIRASQAGDAVEVQTGSYEENLVLDKPGLTLSSAKNQVVVVHQASKNAPLIEITEDGTHVKGLSLRGFTSTPSYGAVDVKANNTTLEDLAILEEEGGVWSLWVRTGADHARISNSTFEATERSDRAIRIDPAADVHLERNRFNPVDGEEHQIGGPWIRSDLNVTITDNTVVDAWGAGITIDQTGPADAQHIVVENNTVVLGESALRDGLTAFQIEHPPGSINGNDDQADFLVEVVESNPGIGSMNLFDRWMLTEDGHPVQAFIDTARPDAMIHLGSGTYEEDLHIEAKNLTFPGIQTVSNIPAQPVIRGSIQAISSHSLALSGLHLEATPNPPLKGVAFATHDVAHVQFDNNTFVADGPVTRTAPHFFSGLLDLSGLTTFTSTRDVMIGSQDGPSGSSVLRVEYADSGNVSLQIQDTDVQDHRAAGVTISGKNQAANLSVLGSRLTGNGDGLLVHSAEFEGLHLEKNTVMDQTDIGIRFVGETRGETTLRHNQFTGNHVGLGVGDDVDPVDARYNWWGSPAGPIFGDQASTLLLDYTPWCLDADCELMG